MVRCPLGSALVASLILGGTAFGQTMTASQRAIDAFNDDVQTTWDRLRPTVEARLRAEAAARLTGLKHTDARYEVEVERVHAIGLSLGAAPGLTALATSGLGLGVPARGAWAVDVEVDVMVRGRFGFWRPSMRLRRVKLAVTDIRLVATAIIDDSDPLRPVVRRVDRPQTSARLRVSGGGVFADLLLRALSPVGNLLANRALEKALDGLAPSLQNLAGLPGPIPGDCPLVPDSGAPVPWQTIAENVDVKLRRDHLPHGTIVHARMSVPSTDTWLQAYGPGGAGNVGVSVPDGDGGDSAIWTGHWLSAQALRWHADRSAVALDNVLHALSGISALFEVHGDTGLLARCAAPVASPMGQTLLRDSSHTTRLMRGETWVGIAGGGGVSRDQYMGVVMGLALTLDLVQDARAQAEATRLVRMIVDYLVGHGWWIDEDRVRFDATTGRGFPTFYTGIVEQRLNILLLGERVAPGRYAAELAGVSPLAETAWLGAWIGTFNLESYYKFNLSHGTAYTLFRLETDPTRWQQSARAFHIMRRYVQHHMNAYFNLVHASVDPSLAATYHPAAREGLRQFLGRCHREVMPAIVDLSGVTWVTVPSAPNLALPGAAPAPATVTMPSRPLPPALRPPAGDFFWQRGPFEAGRPNQGDASAEDAGVDVTLPYWLGRRHGAF
jgi:hypothetical protein